MLKNAPCCPIAVVACYSGSSADDHHVRAHVNPLGVQSSLIEPQMVVAAVRDYIKKMNREDEFNLPPSMPMPVPPRDTRESTV